MLEPPRMMVEWMHVIVSALNVAVGCVPVMMNSINRWSTKRIRHRVSKKLINHDVSTERVLRLHN